MKKLVLFVLLGIPVVAQERVDLTTPITATVNVAINVSHTKVFIRELHLYKDDAKIVIVMKFCDTNTANCRSQKYEYTGSTASTFMIALNKANLTTNTLYKRIIDRLISDGFITGTETGTPE